MCNDIVRWFNSMAPTWSEIKTKYYHIYIYMSTDGRKHDKEVYCMIKIHYK